MVFAAPPSSTGAPAPFHPGHHQGQRIAEGKQRRVFQGHDDDEEEGDDTDKTTSANSEDPSLSHHLYHRLITYPLEEILLPAAQVRGAADRCLRNAVEMLR